MTSLNQLSLKQKVSNYSLTSVIPFVELCDAVQACNLQYTDMDDICEEYGIVQAIVNTPEMVNSHGEERNLNIFSKFKVPVTNLKKVSFLFHAAMPTQNELSP